MTYDPCARCKSGFPIEVCSKFCSLYKKVQEQDVQRQLDETLFKRLARISKK